MHYCNTLISTLLPLLIIFSDPIASDSSSASSSSEEIPKWENPFDDLISSTSDNLFKRWEDTQVSIYLEPYSKGWFPKFQNQSNCDLSIGSAKYQIQILKPKIFFVVQMKIEIYTLNRKDKKTEGEKKFSFLKCIPKSNVIKIFFSALVFSIHIWYLAYPTDRS